ncbi:hypothetical protein EV363DRAFT_1303115 [Boletus edulis]|nr:hypothetical protein EV363DRAFT_1303115 [Boletus edulis]
MYINSTKRQLSVGQDQKKKIKINNQMKQGFRVDGREKPRPPPPSTSKQIPNDRPHPPTRGTNKRKNIQTSIDCSSHRSHPPAHCKMRPDLTRSWPSPYQEMYINSTKRQLSVGQDQKKKIKINNQMKQGFRVDGREKPRPPPPSTSKQIPNDRPHPPTRGTNKRKNIQTSIDCSSHRSHPPAHCKMRPDLTRSWPSPYQEMYINSTKRQLSVGQDQKKKIKINNQMKQGFRVDGREKPRPPPPSTSKQIPNDRPHPPTRGTNKRKNIQTSIDCSSHRSHPPAHCKMRPDLTRSWPSPYQEMYINSTKRQLSVGQDQKKKIKINNQMKQGFRVDGREKPRPPPPSTSKQIPNDRPHPPTRGTNKRKNIQTSIDCSSHRSHPPAHCKMRPDLTRSWPSPYQEMYINSTKRQLSVGQDQKKKIKINNQMKQGFRVDGREKPRPPPPSTSKQIPNDRPHPPTRGTNKRKNIQTSIDCSSHRSHPPAHCKMRPDLTRSWPSPYQEMYINSTKRQLSVGQDQKKKIKINNQMKQGFRVDGREKPRPPPPSTSKQIPNDRPHPPTRGTNKRKNIQTSIDCSSHRSHPPAHCKMRPDLTRSWPSPYQEMYINSTKRQLSVGQDQKKKIKINNQMKQGFRVDGREKPRPPPPSTSKQIPNDRPHPPTRGTNKRKNIQTSIDCSSHRSHPPAHCKMRPDLTRSWPSPYQEMYINSTKRQLSVGQDQKKKIKINNQMKQGFRVDGREKPRPPPPSTSKQIPNDRPHPPTRGTNKRKNIQTSIDCSSHRSHPPAHCKMRPDLTRSWPSPYQEMYINSTKRQLSVGQDQKKKIKINNQMKQGFRVDGREKPRPPPPSTSKQIPNDRPHPPTRGTNKRKNIQTSIDCSSHRSHPPAHILAFPLPRNVHQQYQTPVKCWPRSKKKIKINNQMKQGFRVDGREKPRPPPPSTSKQIPNDRPHPPTRGTNKRKNIQTSIDCSSHRSHPPAHCKMRPDLTRSWPSPYQEMYINSTKRQLSVGQDQKKKIKINNQMKQGFRVDGREKPRPPPPSTSKQIPNDRPHPPTRGTNKRKNIQTSIDCSSHRSHPPAHCKMRPDLTRSWPSPYQEMYINSTKRQLSVGQDQKKKIKINNQMKQGFRVDGREKPRPPPPSTSKQIPNDRPHPPTRGTNKRKNIQTSIDCSSHRSHPPAHCKMRPDLTRSWPSPYQEMYINSTKRQLSVGQDQKKKIKINNQMKQGFRVDGREKPRPPPPSTSKQIPNDRPHPPTRGTNKRKNIQTSIDCSSHRSHPPAHCKMRPDLTRSWPSPYQEMYINSTKRQLSVGQDQKKKIKINNQMKQGFRVDGREKPRPPPPSTSKQIPNDRPHPPTRGTNKRKNIQTSIDCSSHRSHPPAHCKMRPDLTRSWPSPYQEMYINSTKRQLSVGQDQKKKIKINNQMKQGFRVDGREKPRPPPPSTSKQIPNDRPHPPTRGTNKRKNIQTSIDCSSHRSHPPAHCKMRPDLTRSWPSPYQEMYINSTKRQLSVGQDQKKKIKINNQMKQGFRVDGREKPRPPPPSTSKQIPNDRPHPPTRGTNKRKNIQTSIDCSSHRSHPPAHCKMRPDLTRSWPSPYQEMYINSTKRQLSVGQDQKKKIKINNQMKQGFRVDGREKPRPPPPSTSKQIPNDRPHPAHPRDE